ncbi:unnamed protein product [Urochloa humidicola]
MAAASRCLARDRRRRIGDGDLEGDGGIPGGAITGVRANACAQRRIEAAAAAAPGNLPHAAPRPCSFAAAPTPPRLAPPRPHLPRRPRGERRPGPPVASRAPPPGRGEPRRRALGVSGSGRRGPGSAAMVLSRGAASTARRAPQPAPGRRRRHAPGRAADRRIGRPSCAAGAWPTTALATGDGIFF